MPIFNRIAPARGRIVVEPFETPKMRGGLYIPDTAVNEARSSQIGTVIWAYTGVYRGDDLEFDSTPARYAPGDVVLFGKWSGAEIELEGRIVYCLSEGDIMGTLHADPEEFTALEGKDLPFPEEVSSDNPG